MENTVLNYNKIEIPNYLGDNDTVIMRNITDSHYEFSDKYYNEKYYDVAVINDDERLDNIAHRYYNDVNKWDLIMLFNQIDSPLLLPKNYNFVLERANIWYELWYNTYGDYKPDWFLSQKKAYFVQLSAKENEKYRSIKLLKKQYIVEIMKAIDDDYRVTE